MKVEVGMKVLVNPDFMSLPNLHGVVRTGDMDNLAGSIVTIIETWNEHFAEVKEDIGWTWDTSWFLPITYDQNELFQMFVKGKISESSYKMMLAQAGNEEGKNDGNQSDRSEEEDEDDWLLRELGL